MSLVLCCQQMKRLLAVPPSERGATWAHDLCTASRFIHINVWRFCPKHDEVRNTVLPLLKDAKRELLCLIQNTSVEEARKKIGEYASNDEKRIANIEKNYLSGKLSAFLPDHKLSEPPAQAG